ncbi:Abi family protein [Formosa sp. 3Alg 14/1]|uniref:Abi family protein n=1 Tax=Formosa sp. 3Alg 14/1 TaxID=3382190 RepID=UPI0039BDA624
MGSLATTIDQQIEKLIERGIVFNDDNEIEKAKEILLDIGYYRLGFYWYYFQDKKTHMFNESMKLDDIVKLYYFDFDVKMLLLRYIYRIEVHFRTQLVYLASNHYSENNTWYVDPKIIDNKMLKEFNNIYFNLKTKSNTLIKHHNNYSCDYAPAWKVFEFLTFGQIFKFFTKIKNQELKKKIASVYGFRDVSLLNNYLISLINIRNICSHNGVLFDYNQSVGIKRIPNLKYRVKTSNTTNLNASIRLLLFVLSKVSQNRANELETELQILFDKSCENELVNGIVKSKIKFDI